MAKTETPLLRFLRALEKVERKEEFAAACGTKLLYLYQLAGKEDPNPTLRLAMKLRDESAKWAKRLHVPALTFDDLLVGARVIED